MRDIEKAAGVRAQHPDAFDCRLLDVTDAPAVHALVDAAFTAHGRIDAVMSNAGYGLFGCAEAPHSENDHISISKSKSKSRG